MMNKETWHGQNLFLFQIRVVTSPFGIEGFAESFIGDQFVSLSQAFQDTEYFVCYYVYEATWSSQVMTSKCM